MKPKKTLAQMQREAVEGEGGGCRMCGCKMTEVADSRPLGFASAKRQRRCRNCKEPVTTVEVPVPEGFKIKVVPEDEEEVAA